MSGWFSEQALEPNHPWSWSCPKVGGVNQAAPRAGDQGDGTSLVLGLACTLSPLTFDPGAGWGGCDRPAPPWCRQVCRAQTERPRLTA